ncbi:Rv3235 family protein [Nocardia sp. NPDC059180]|uniref:Rv3235 family protein n=1 Tax=Nocardia sp. NPDC059180 TaxID=3346761 RepID=UPI0036C7EE2B
MAEDQMRLAATANEAPTRVCGSGIRTRRSGNPAASACGTRRATSDPRAHIPPKPSADRTPDAAQAFAEQAVRAALEILDRRRPIAQLRAFASPDVDARIRTLATGGLPGRSLGLAVPVRVRITMTDGPAAEVCARYRRGPRNFALAAQVTHTRRHGWRLTAIRVA